MRIISYFAEFSTFREALSRPMALVRLPNVGARPTPTNVPSTETGSDFPDARQTG